MASPQKEHGYTAIANAIMEALAKTRIPGEPRQVLDHILRRTYGWNKKEAAITHREFMLATGLKRQNVSRALKRLSDINMVGIKVDAFGRRFYCFIKDFDTWSRLFTMAHLLALTGRTGKLSAGRYTQSGCLMKGLS